MGTSISFMLPATIWTWQLAGTLDFTAGGVLAGHASSATLGVLLLLYVLGAGEGGADAVSPLATGGYGRAHARLRAPSRSGGGEGRGLHRT